MKVRVLKKFRDKHSGEYHKKGKLLIISKERFAEISATDKTLVEEVKDTKKAEAPAVEEAAK